MEQNKSDLKDLPSEDLERHRIQHAPSSMYYIPNFISEEEEDFVLGKIPSNRWISLSRRRLQALPARLTGTNILVASSGLPDWLTRPIINRINDLGFFSNAPHGINHCLINEYLSGQGIMPHEDGAAYHPVVATVSLGGSIVLDVTAKSTQRDDTESTGNEIPETMGWRILQEPRSLLVTTGPAYQDTLHGIAEVQVDQCLNEDTVANWNLLGNKQIFSDNGGYNKRTTRLSLTYRDVLRVSNVGSKIFGKPRT